MSRIPSVQQVQKALQGTPMASEAAAIYNAAMKNGVNPAFVVGLAGAESSFGSAGYARGTHNPYGYGVHSGFRYPSYAAATDAMTKSLSGSLYKGSGLTHIQDIINKYTPSSDGNNPQAHVQHIESLGGRTGGDASQVFVDPVSGAANVNGQTVSETPGQTQDLMAQYIKSAVAQKHPGQSLFRAVMSGVQAAQTANAFSGVPAQATQSAQGTVQAAGRAGTAMSAAQQELGVPYSWGGGSPSGPGYGTGRGANTRGFDCSSLVQYAWAKAGVSIPRTTQEQIAALPKVQSLSQARPGDLLYPHSGHVQMYLGNGKVIEAPFTGGHVRVTGLRSSYTAIRRPGG